MYFDPPQLTDLIGRIINGIYTNVGNVGVAVILFTLIVRTVALPLDIWQKVAMRKQQKGMARIQPQLDKLKKQYEDQPQVFRMEQQKLMKKEKISMFGSCLPLIANMALLFWMLAGFRAFVAYQNQLVLHNLAMRYHGGYDIMYNHYNLHSFLWISNVFMPDNWSSIIPSITQFSSGGFGGGIGASFPPSAEGIYMSYQTLVGPAAAHYTGWNGWLILPILIVATSFLTSKLMQNQNPMAMGGDEKAKTQKRVMMLMGPAMMAVFALFQSSAFALYMLFSNIFIAVVGLTFNFAAKLKDKNASIEAQGY